MKLADVLKGKLCPLCNLPGADIDRSDNRSSTAYVHCERCGNFLISYEAIEVLTRENKYLLSAVCRNWTGNPIPTILTDNINSLIKQAPRLGIAEQMDALLDLVAQKTAKLGDCSSFNTLNDYPLLSFRGRDEAEFLISALIQRHHIAAARVNDFETHAHGVY